MVRIGLFARLRAKSGKESEVAKFLAEAIDLANLEAQTTVWFALRFDESTFGIFDAFADEAGRKGHLNGRIAAALMARSPELFAEAPRIEQVEVLAAKLPG